MIFFSRPDVNQHFGLKRALPFIVPMLCTACVSGDYNDAAPLQVLPSIPIPFVSEAQEPVTSNDEIEVIEASEEFLEDNSTYMKIALAVADIGALSSRLELQGRHYDQEAFRRTLLPQLTPVVNTNQDGDVIGRVLIEQIIFDSGRFRAGRKVLNSEQAVAFAQYVIQFNTRVSNAVDAYLRSHRSRQLSTVSTLLADRYENMYARAEQRLSGGVGKKSELSLFEIKRLENLNEAASDKAVADAAMLELETLTGQRFGVEPSRFEFTSTEQQQPPAIALANAEKKVASAELRVQQAERLPEVRLQGSVGRGTSFGSGFDDQPNTLTAGIRLNQPLTWGKDYGLKSSRAQFHAAEARVREQARDINAELERLKLQAQSFEIQLSQSAALVAAANERADEFEQQFLGGAIGIVEAVSILDTYKRAARMKIEMEFSLYDAERQIAQIHGLFGPFREE